MHGWPWSILLVVLTAGAWAAEPENVPVPSITIINPNRIAIGQQGSLEGNAMVARARGAEANWYNAAGLGGAGPGSFSANATVFEYSFIDVEGLGTDTRARAFDQIPAYLSSNLPVPWNNNERGWGLGFSVTTPVSWNQSVDVRTDVVLENGETATASYDALSSLETIVPALQLGYAIDDRLRLGGGIEGWYTRSDTREQTSLTALSDDTLTLTTTATSVIGEATHVGLRATLGFQWQANDWLRLGGQFRTPGWTIYNTGRIRIVLASDTDDVDGFVDFADDEVTVTFRSPWQARLGAAVIQPGWELELDVYVIGGGPSYHVFDLSQDAFEVIATLNAPDVNFVVTEPLTLDRTDPRTVVNVQLGGHYTFLPSWRIHGGFRTDVSPVENDSDTFTDIDLWHLTLGVSQHNDHRHVAIGMGYTFGREAIGGQTVLGSSSTEIDLTVQTLSLVLATNFTF